MKKLFYVLFVCCLGTFASMEAKAGVGCSIDTSTCQALGFYGQVCPGLFPAGTAGAFYSAQNSFTMPSQFDLDTDALGLGFGVITVTVTEIRPTVTGLPRGLTAVFDDADGVYDPTTQSSGCFQVAGTPCDLGGTYDVQLSFSVKVTLPIIGAFTVPFPVTSNMSLALTSTYPSLAITSPSKFLCASGAGSTINATATAGFDSYSWSGTGDTTATTTISTPGTYYVTVTAGAGACDFVDSITIANLDAQVNGPATICANHFLQLSATGGDNFLWSPAANLSSATSPNPVILRGLTNTTTFQVIVSNADCSDTASVTITVDNNCTSDCGSCSVNSAGCGGPVPAICGLGGLPAVTGGVAYDESFTFYIPDTIDVDNLLPIPGIAGLLGLPPNYPINEVSITIDSLPAGLNWSCDQSGSNCTYYPALDPTAQYGCIRICGTTCAPAGTYLMAQVGIKLPQTLRDIIASIPFPLGIDSVAFFPLQISLDVEYTNPLTITPSGPTVINEGESVTLAASTTGFTGFSWSSGETTSSITVTESGEYCVTSNDGNCNQTTCQDVEVLTSVTDLDVAASLNIYPNPSEGSFTISYSLRNAQTITFEVFDLAGKLIHTQTAAAVRGTNNTNISLQNAAKGIYFVKLTTANGTVNSKIAVK
jgi:hypothetical protein